MQGFLSNVRLKLQIISRPTWLYVFMGLALFIISLMLGSLLSQNWVHSSSWSGGILRINSGPHSGEHYSHQDCSSCLYGRLYRAGIVMIVFELLALILTMIWLAYLVFLLRGIEIFQRFILIPILVLAVLFHLIGIITWGGVTRLGFQGKERSSTGPALAVTVSVLYPLICAMYFLVFTNEREHIPEMNSVRFERRHQWSEHKNVEVPDNRN